jgi:hypothetical protein
VRGLPFLVIALLLAGCASAQSAAPSARETTGVSASCAALSPAEQFAAARVVLVGVMLPGPATHTGVLVSPARMRVERYLKGRGPRVVKVATAVRIEGGSTAVAEDGIEPRAGERWKVYTQSLRQPFDASLCAGSTRVVMSPALALWRAFPVHATPRPIVPLGEGAVLDPPTGLGTDSQEFAYLEGRFVLRTALPRGSAIAYRRLLAHHNGQHLKAPPLMIVRVRAGNATFVTDRGRRRLPVWEFYFRGVASPASVLALAPPSVFIAPPLHRFGPPGGPGNSLEDSAKLSGSGTTITLSFAGRPPGNAPCEANYRAGTVSDSRAVAFTITTPAVPVQSGQVCPALAVIRTVSLHLSHPLGARVLVSAADGGAVPVTSG